MKILVTGATGLVGEAVAARLAGLGHEVVGLSRRVSGVLPSGVRQLQADLGEPESLAVAVRGVECEAVVHCVADRTPRAGDASVVRVNCLGTQQVIELARRWKARSLVYISGVAVIGRPVEHPVTEEHPVGPLNEYVAAKLFGEYLAEIAGREGVMAACTLRLTAPVGARMPGNRLLSSVVEKALRGDRIEINGDGSRRQNYVDVLDVARGVEQVIGGRVSGLFNIGGRDTVSNLELGRRCVEVVGSKSEIVVGGQPDPDDGVVWDVCCEKARERFGYRAEVGIEESIRSLACVRLS